MVCICLALVLLPARGEAGDDGRQRRSPYVRLYTGIGITRPSDLRIRRPALKTDLTFERVSWEHKSLSTNWDRDSIPYDGVRGGFFLREPAWLSLSVEVLHFKVFAEAEKPVRVRGIDEGAPIDTVTPMTQFVQVYQVSNGVNMVWVACRPIRAWPEPPVSPMGVSTCMVAPQSA